jgi:hypothetical protein
MKRTQKEIDDMMNAATAAWDKNASPFNEGVMAAFAWLNGDDDILSFEDEDDGDDA